MPRDSKHLDLQAMMNIDGLKHRLDCSRRHIYRLLDADLLPKPLKLGKLVRWDRATIETWISNGCPATNGSAAGQEGGNRAKS